MRQKLYFLALLSHTSLVWGLALILVTSLLAACVSTTTPSVTATTTAKSPSGVTATPTSHGVATATPIPPGPSSQWQFVASPNSSSTGGRLTALSTISAANIWTVGYKNAASVGNYPQDTLIEHWDGTAWTIVPSPQGWSQYGNGLFGVAAVSANDIWAVGVSGYISAGNHFRPLIEHWNGTSWSVVGSPLQIWMGAGLSAVAVVSASDIWAIGQANNGQGVPETLTEHWNGSQWNVVASPSPGLAPGGDDSLHGVAVVSTNDVWAVGDYSISSNSRELALIEQWNGSQWNVIPCLDTGATFNALSAVSVISANNIWAVGYSSSDSDINASQTLIEQWDGSQWGIITSPNVGTYSNQLLSIDAVSANDIWAVGEYQNNKSDRLHTLIEQWNGSQWSIIPISDGTQGNNGLSAVAVVSSGNVWGVGAAIASLYIPSYPFTGDTNPQTLIAHYGS